MKRTGQHVNWLQPIWIALLTALLRVALRAVWKVIKPSASGIERETGIRATSTIQAIVEALEDFKVHRLIIIGPGIEGVERKGKAFLRRMGSVLLI